VRLRGSTVAHTEEAVDGCEIIEIVHVAHRDFEVAHPRGGRFEHDGASPRN
jgi:hypothetical protein